MPASATILLPGSIRICGIFTPLAAHSALKISERLLIFAA